MRVVLTILVRDEADIVERQLRYHYARGIDFVIATDHRSVDGTTEILRRFEAEGRLHYIREESEHIDQADWMTRMSRIAATEHDADWVIPSDADEFWWPRRGTFHEVLAAIPAEVGVVRGFIRTFAPRPDDGRPFFERMTMLARPVSDHADIYLPNVHVLHRAHPLVTLTRGFHDAEADGLGRLIRDWCPFEVLHFPNRTAAQIERKYEQAWQAWSDYPSGGGEHVHASHQTLQTEGPQGLYAQRVVEGEELEDGIRRGAFVEDTRLRDALREIDQGRLPAPAPPTPEQEAQFQEHLAAMKQHDVAARLLTSLNDFDRRVSTLERNDAGEVVDVETIPSQSQTPRPAPVRPARRRQRVRVALPAAIAAAFLVFGVLPEALGDWPYNAWGKDTRHSTTHSHVPSTLHTIGSRHDVN